MMKRGNYAMLKRMCVRGKCHPLLRGKVRTTLVCPPIFCIIFPFSFTLVLFFSQRLFFFSFPLLAFSPFYLLQPINSILYSQGSSLFYYNVLFYNARSTETYSFISCQEHIYKTSSLFLSLWSCSHVAVERFVVVR